MNEVAQQTDNRMVQRFLGILLRPNATWHAIAREPAGLKGTFIPYGAAMAFIPAVLTFLQRWDAPLQSGQMALVMLLSGLITPFVIGVVMVGLAAVFGARKS